MTFPWLMSNVKCAYSGRFLANGKEYHVIQKNGRKASVRIVRLGDGINNEG